MNVQTDDPRWEEYVLDKHKEYFGLVSSFLECAHDLLDKFADKGITGEDLGQDGLVVCFLFAKTYKSTKAALRLCKSGYTEDALILARANFEAALWALYIAQDRGNAEEKAKAFIRYDAIDRKQQLDKIIEMYVEDNESKVKFLEVSNRVERELPKTQEERKRVCRLADKNLFQLAKEVRLTHLLYRTFYWESSKYVHSKPGCAKSYVSESNGHINFLLIPTETGLRNVLIHLCLFLWYLMDRFNYLFELGFEKTLSEKWTELDEIYKKTEPKD